MQNLSPAKHAKFASEVTTLWRYTNLFIIIIIIIIKTNLAGKINKTRQMHIPHDTQTTFTAGLTTPHSNSDS